jgi:hypothetical protein
VSYVLGDGRRSTDLVRVTFELVVNRALANDMAATEWAAHDVSLPGLAAMSEGPA